MRPALIGFALLGLFAVPFVACSQDPTSSATGSGTGGAPNCDAIIIVNGVDAGNICEACLHRECCAEVANCADKYCKDCVNLYADGCETNARVNALNQCIGLHRSDSTSCTPELPHPTSSSGAGTTTSSTSSG